MQPDFALIGARIFDANRWYEDHALLVAGRRVADIVPRAVLDATVERRELPGGLLVPGFVDLQVNGGGGVQFNADPSVDGIATICAAHAPFGTTALLPTLITDNPDVTEAAIAAGHAAARAAIPGFMGLHIEGPHLSEARKGAHRSDLIRPMQDADRGALIAAVANLQTLLVTVAPENVSIEAISALDEAGIVVCIGHSDATCSSAITAAEAGARIGTHLFNAMSPFTHREPGLVGAILDDGDLFAGLIADGHHVDPVAMRVALRAKRGPGRIFLVTDAMAPLGTNMTEFTLNGRRIVRANNCLRLEDGTLAGADLTMIEAVRQIYRTVGQPLEEALRMASLYPAQAARRTVDLGHLGKAARANFVHLSKDLSVCGTWIDGRLVWARPVGEGDDSPCD